VILFSVLVVVLVLAFRALYVLVSINYFARSWERGNAQPVQNNSIVMVALGDSTVQGIGAIRPSDGFVGQLRGRTAKQLGRPVQVYNFSKTGGESGDVVKDQLPRLKALSRVDVVVVAVGPNDITHKKTLSSFLANYEQILKQVPASKTVISNMPPMGPRDADGKTSRDWGIALSTLAAKYNVKTAPVYENVNKRANDPRTYAGDFYHPSRAGYVLWANAFEPEVLKVVAPKS